MIAPEGGQRYSKGSLLELNGRVDDLINTDHGRSQQLGTSHNAARDGVKYLL